MTPQESGENEVGFWDAMKGGLKFFVWFWRNRRKMAVAVPVLTLIIDQFYGPHVMKHVWHNVRHDQAIETNVVVESSLVPVLNGIAKTIKDVRDEQILQHRAIENLPGGKRAISAALRARSRDSAAEAGWHPPKTTEAAREGLEVGNLAIIRPGIVDPN